MIEYDNQGRMKYNPELHENQGKPWGEEDLEYLIAWYEIIGAEEMSLALGRPEAVIANKVSKLRKSGLMKRPTKEKHVVRLLRVTDESKTILI